MRILFYPQLLTLLIPIAFAVLIGGRWKDRMAFMLVGFGVAWGVGFVSLLLWALGEALSKSVGIGPGSELYFSLPLGYWIGLAVSYFINFLGVYSALRLLRPKLVPKESLDLKSNGHCSTHH